MDLLTLPFRATAELRSQKFPADCRLLAVATALALLGCLAPRTSTAADDAVDASSQVSQLAVRVDSAMPLVKGFSARPGVPLCLLTGEVIAAQTQSAQRTPLVAPGEKVNIVADESLRTVAREAAAWTLPCPSRLPVHLRVSGTVTRTRTGTEITPRAGSVVVFQP